MHLPAYEDGTDSVPKRRHIKFRRRGITQKKIYTTYRTRRKFEIRKVSALHLMYFVLFNDENFQNV
jgi:hypothetical protein